MAMIEGTEAKKVITVLDKIPEAKRNSVEEVTLDMANSMRKIVRSCFPNANGSLTVFMSRNWRMTHYKSCVLPIVGMQ